MDPQTIIFYSPLSADLPLHKIGGAEAGCRRTVEILKGMGYRLLMCTKPTMNDGAAAYLKGAVRSIRVLRRRIREGAGVLYMIGYYEKNIYLETLLLRMARRKGLRLIYDTKNGNLVDSYRTGGRIYRKTLEKAMRLCDVRFCQGTSFVRFLRDEFGISGTYLPNYVMDRYLADVSDERNNPIRRLLFFGRIDPDKRVDVAVRCAASLQKRGIDNELILIGAYLPEYRRELEELSEREGMPEEKVIFTGNMPFDALYEELKTADFFIFPSANRKEGHSNSLTEAMACGVIPVCSTAGFNREIVGNDELVVPDLEAEHYADRIEAIIKLGKERELRAEMIRRVRENYTQSIVTDTMRESMTRL